MNDRLFKEVFQRTLIVVPHPDDEVIGCGGTMAKAVDLGCDVRVLVGTVNVNGDLFERGRDSELRDALSVLGVNYAKVLCPGSDGRLDAIPILELVRRIDDELCDFLPTCFLMPYPSFHQDHKRVFDASMAATRPRTPEDEVHITMVALYEYPYSVWQYGPIHGGKWLVDISDYLDKKVEAMSKHGSQLKSTTHLISESTLQKWAEFRGIGYSMAAAEMFYVQRFELR